MDVYKFIWTFTPSGGNDYKFIWTFAGRLHFDLTRLELARGFAAPTQPVTDQLITICYAQRLITPPLCPVERGAQQFREGATQTVRPAIHYPLPNKFKPFIPRFDPERES